MEATGANFHLTVMCIGLPDLVLIAPSFEVFIEALVADDGRVIGCVGHGLAPVLIDEIIIALAIVKVNALAIIETIEARNRNKP